MSKFKTDTDELILFKHNTLFQKCWAIYCGKNTHKIFNKKVTCKIENEIINLQNNFTDENEKAYIIIQDLQHFITYYLFCAAICVDYRPNKKYPSIGRASKRNTRCWISKIFIFDT